MWLNSDRIAMAVDEKVVIQGNVPLPLKKRFSRVLIEEVAIYFISIFRSH